MPCVLFDCDGTLVDSELLGFVGMAKEFSKLGVLLKPEDLCERFRGWRLKPVLDELSREAGLVLPPDFEQSYRNTVAGLFDTRLKPIPGITLALESIPFPKAVVSSGPLMKIEHTLGLCGLTKYFAKIFSSYDVGIWKPDPRIYLHAAAQMGFEPSACIVVEDGLVGVEAGIRAGMKTLFFNQHGQASPFAEAVVFSSMDALPDLIERFG